MRELRFRAYVHKTHWVAKKEKLDGDWFVVDDWQDTIFVECCCLQPPKGEGIHVVQYVGLKDKNGREIYEGDLVEHVDTGENPCVVEWETEWSRFTAVDRDGMGFSVSENYCEIVGNIYENPELLEEK